MTVIALPHEATTDAASVWIGCDEPGPPDLVLHWTDNTGDRQEPLQGLQRSAPFGNFHYWLHELTNLPPATQTVTVTDPADGALGPQASVELKPLRGDLPADDTSKFRVLIGSCFSHKGAAANPTAIRDAMDAVVNQGRTPDLTILCGDQVYLDDESGNPVAFTPDDYWSDLSQPYLDAWGFSGDPSIEPILRHGATWFTPDDHEWWNNFPEWAPLVPAAYNACWGQPWAYVARQLVAAFQPTRRRQFDAGGLSFFVADTRSTRTSVLTSQRQLFDPGTLTDVQNWIAGLSTPGVLVLAQPFFQDAAGTLLAVGVDAKLADFDADYAQLLGALDERTQPIVILAGDVHYSRVASTTAAPTLVEVVSSPIALLPGGLAPAPANAHDPGVASLTPTTKWVDAAPGFLLLEFHSNDDGDPEMAVQQVVVGTQTIQSVPNATTVLNAS